MTLPPSIRKERKAGARLSSPGHLDYVRSKHCLVEGCRVLPIHAHHVRLGSHAGTGERPGDDKAVGLCHLHHEEVHKGELTFQVKYHVNLQVMALAYAAASPVLRRRRQRQ